MLAFNSCTLLPLRKVESSANKSINEFSRFSGKSLIHKINNRGPMIEHRGTQFLYI